MFRKLFVKYFDVVRTLAAILVGFAISLLCIIFISDDPVSSLSAFMMGPFASVRRFGNMIEFMIPITLTALGMCLMMQVGEFNLIGEGTVFLSGALAAYMCTKVIPANCPPVLFPFIVIVVGALAGMICALVPALLKIKWGANEVVVTIMLNYVLYQGGMYILMYMMRDPSVTYLGSGRIPANASLIKIIPKTGIHFGLIIAILAIAFTYVYLYHTKKGLEARLVGTNRSFAKYVGVGVTGVLILTQMLGGAMAGIAGTVEILGRYDRFIWVTQLGYGFDGMMVAVIAKKNPLLVPLAAFFLAYIRTGADIAGTTTDVPMQFVQVMQAIIIMLVGATMFLDYFRRKQVVKLATEGGTA